VLDLTPGPRPATEDRAERVQLRLSRTMLRTVGDWNLIREGDKILVALSGGKDSYTLLDLLWRARRRAPVEFELVAYHLDQGQPGYNGGPLRGWLEAFGAPFEIAREDTYTAVIDDAEKTGGGTYCRLCSRLRRSVLYSAARRLGCNKIALGHHRDDSLETLLLNLFYSGRLQAMPAIYTTNEGDFEVIRPLIECGETSIAEHARERRFPILPCNLCGSQNDLKRVEIKRLLIDLEKNNPNVRSVMLAALKNVRPSHLLDAEVAQAWLSQADRYDARQ
jgi:tRNA 2-thiocytidine biosynthesis protein TtcA